MNIILFTKSSRKPTCINLSQRKLVFLFVAILVVFPAIVMFGGYQLGQYQAQNQLLPDNWEAEMAKHREEIKEASQYARENMNALAARLGKLQAQSIRLNALGERLVDIAELDKGEFGFGKVPAQGGPEVESNASAMEVPDFLKELDSLALRIEDREQQLKVMESFFMRRGLSQQTSPAGRPIKKGWISSYYGMRTDPFTGLQERHNGLDFAGKAGSDIVAIASGIVTWSGDRYGYGQMVEINHGNGYVTRYAHNKENLVSAGDTVVKGDVIGHMGSSGRSTGPHVHLEILYKNQLIDPAKLVYAAR